MTVNVYTVTLPMIPHSEHLELACPFHDLEGLQYLMA